MEHPAPWRCLIGSPNLFACFVRPQGDHMAVGPATHRVFCHIAFGGECPGHAVIFFPQSRDVQTEPLHLADAFLVWLHLPHQLFFRQNAHQISPQISFHRRYPQGCGEFRCDWNGAEGKGGQVHGQPFPLFFHSEPAAQGVKRHLLQPGLHKTDDHIGRCQCGMAAQLHFSPWRKPAQMIAAPFRDGKGRFRQIVFHGDFLHDIFGQPTLHHTNSRRIAGKNSVCKGIHYILSHPVSPFSTGRSIFYRPTFFLPLL